MATVLKKPETVDDYLAGLPKETQMILGEIRKMIRKIIPTGEEVISYGVPTFKIEDQPVIYYAGYKNHVSLYPAPRSAEKFKKDLSVYKGGKGTVQFPLNEPLPLKLITEIVKYRLRDTMDRIKTRKR